MKTHKLSGACAVIAVMVAMAVAAPAQANPGSPNASDLPIASAALTPSSLDPLTNAAVLAVARLGVPIPRAREAIAVQSAVEREDLVDELDTALGDAYGGVWYVPAVAQLHVGVTSRAAAETVEALAVQAGLGSRVTEIPVRSSEAELTETQERWNRRLSDLLAREEVGTQASVEDNTVYVELGSEVPAGERATLEAEASKAPVEIVVTSVPSPKLGVVLEAQCGEFAEFDAFCDPGIVGGTTLEDAGGPWCTTGPAVVPPGGSTDTYVLTAGHCIEEVGEIFFSREKKAGAEAEEIGKAVAFLSEKAGNNVDVGVIEVENEFWTEEEEEKTPLAPTIAQWSSIEETEPFQVKGQAEPVAKTTTCRSGQRTGYHCGTVLAVNVTRKKVEKLVEVSVKTNTGKGDSGGPWFSGGEEKLIEGTHVGKNKATNNPVFQPLSVSFQRLEEVSKLKLELLTEKNKVRM